MAGAGGDWTESRSGTTVLAASERVRRRHRGPGSGQGPGWHGALGVAGEFTLTLGVLVLLFVVWQVWWVTKEATSASAAVVQQLGREFAEAASRAPRAGEPAPNGGTALPTADVPIGAAIGLITVPRLGNGPQPVLQGTALTELDRGVGHDPGSAMPGQIGNFATAGHRDTYSHPYELIDTIRLGDAVVVEVSDGWALYVVERTRIVEPTQVEVYAPVPDEPRETPTEGWMTMVACEPHWTAQKRWVVHARLQAWVARTALTPTAASHPRVAAALAPPADG